MAKVLLVEDDNNLREIYEARLQAEGYEIVSASDGEQALAIAKETKPDLVISDVMMPKISGFEMLDILRNTDGMKEVKVIMLTALGQAEDKTRADQLGANRYLVKSQVTLEDIVKSAHQLLDDEPAAATPAPAVEPAATPAVDAPAAPTVELAAAPAADPAATPLDAPSDDVATPAVDDQPDASTAPAAGAVSDDAPTTAQEEADMAAQISSFEQQPAAPAAEATPEPVVTPLTAAPAAEPAAPTPSAPSENDKTMADAVDSLTAVSAQRPSDVTAIEVAPEPGVAAPTASTPSEPASPVTETATPEVAAAPAETTGDGTTVAHKKIIAPISDMEAPKADLNALLAAEQAKEIMSQAADTPAPQVVTSSSPPAPAPTAPPADGIDPNSIAL